MRSVALTLLTFHLLRHTFSLSPPSDPPFFPIPPSFLPPSRRLPTFLPPSSQADAERWQARCRTADANVAAIRKQTEGLQLEYDRLVSDNESLRSQLSVFDRKYSTAKEGL